MHRLLASLALTCLAIAAAAAERIPADCRWVLQMDVKAALASQAGEWIARQAVRQPLAARLKVLEAISGLDVRRDLRLVTICGADSDDSTGLILVRGTFDAAKLELLVSAAEGHEEVKAGHRTIHVWQDKGKPAAGCLAAPDLLILGKSAARIRDAIALVDDPSRPAARIAVPEKWEQSALLFGAADRIDALIKDKPASAMLGNVRSCAARIVEQGADMVLEAHAVAASEAAAQQLVDAGRGLAAIVQLQKPAELDPALAESLRNGRLDRAGTAVDLRLSLPVADLLRLVEKRAGL
ncbi:MAG: hypothetical protein J0M02_13125 [Planctomycetes bacterium]|nr:hypothetical protein [Planctomycetota bacterium]